MGYIPRKDSELLNWARNFASCISQNPARVGLRPSQAQEIQSVMQDYADAYKLAAAPATRTATAMAAKNAARKAMLKQLRGYAMLIKHNRALADDDKINLGLNITPISKARHPAPTSRPLISVESGPPCCHVLRFTDSDTPDSRRRPRGVAGLQLYCCLSEKTPAGPESAPLAAACGRTFYRHKFPHHVIGQRAHYWARWHTRRGLFGPWSQRVSLVVPG